MLDSRISKALQSLQQVPQVAGSGPTTPRPSASPDKSSSGQSKCRPLSLDDFNARLASFGNVTNWFAKPTSISPAVCARYGWRSAGVDLLECSACNAALSFRTPAVTAQSTVDQLAAQWAVQLAAAGHKPYCPWRENPSPEAFTTCFPHGVPHRASVADDLLDRWTSLVNNIQPAQLPVLASAFWSAQLVSQLWLARPAIMQRITEMAVTLAATRGAASAAYTARWRDYAALALFGWSFTSNAAQSEGHLSIHCSVCCRDVGLWNFTSPSAPPAASAIGSGTSVVSSAAAVTPPPPTPRPSLHSSMADLPLASSELRVSRDAFPTQVAAVFGSLPVAADGATTPPLGASATGVGSGGGAHLLRSSTAVLATKRAAPSQSDAQTDSDAGDHNDSVIKKLRHSRTELNPAKEHRWFCPWIAGAPPGWQHLLQLLDASAEAQSASSTTEVRV